MGSLQPRSQGPEGAVVWGRGQSIPLLFTPAVHQVEAGGFAANPGGDLASGREDQDAAITFGDAPVPDHPSPKHRSPWAVSPGAGDSSWGHKTGRRPFWGLCSAALLLSAGRSLHLVAESRTTDWGQAGLGQGAMSSPNPQPWYSSLSTELPFPHCKFLESLRTEMDIFTYYS